MWYFFHSVNGGNFWVFFETKTLQIRRQKVPEDIHKWTSQDWNRRGWGRGWIRTLGKLECPRVTWCFSQSKFPFFGGNPKLCSTCYQSTGKFGVDLGTKILLAHSVQKSSKKSHFNQKWPKLLSKIQISSLKKHF